MMAAKNSPIPKDPVTASKDIAHWHATVFQRREARIKLLGVFPESCGERISTSVSESSVNIQLTV